MVRDRLLLTSRDGRGEAHRLQVGHDVEDDEVVQEVEESWNGPLEKTEVVRTRGATQLFA